MKIHYNSIDGDNDKLQVTLKTCDKTETQGTKKHVVRGKEKDPPVLRSNRKKHLQTNQLQLIYYINTLNSFSLTLC